MARYSRGKCKFTSGLAVSAMTAAAIATAGLGSAPTANATCASFFGIGNSANCTSTPLSIAVAIGTGATANAKGLFGAAFSVGTGAVSETRAAFDFAVAAGDNSLALGDGLFGIAASLGPSSYAATSGAPTLGNLGFNIALNVSPTNKAVNSFIAGGIGNVALNLFGTSNDPFGNTSYAVGVASITGNVGGQNNQLSTSFDGFANTAFNFFGNDNTVVASPGSVNAAFNLFGSGNTVTAGPGPLAIAGAIAQNGKPISKQQPGININGLKVPNTAAANNRKPAPSSAAKAPKVSATAKAGGSERKSARKAN